MSTSITIRRGQTINWPCTFRDENGAVVDLTGFTIAARARVLKSPAFIVLTVVPTVLASGTFSVYLLDSSVLTEEHYEVDIWYTEPGGDFYPIDTFDLHVTPGI